MEIHRLDRASAAATRALLGDLRVSAFGVHSPRLHRALVSDALDGLVDCRIALNQGAIVGVVLAAPASYWRQAPLRHWALAFECARARWRRRAPHAGERNAAPAAGQDSPISGAPVVEDGTPPRSWADPGDAWRIIFVGTTPAARGRGVGAQLYRTLAAERPLVARIARDNTPSLRLHASVGWRLFHDDDVILAVHAGPAQSAATGAGRR